MNKNILLLFFLALSTIRLSAQSSNFALKIESNIGYSDRFFISDGSIPSAVEEILQEREKPKVSYEIGLLVAYQLNDKVSFLSGIRYTEWGYKTGKIELRPPAPDPSIPDFMAHKSQNRYLEFPIRVNYSFQAEKTNSIFIWGGLATSYNLSNHVVSTSYFPDETTSTRTEDIPLGYEYQKINFIGELGIGFSKDLSDKIAFTVGPNIRSQLFGVIKDAPLNRQLFFYGLSLGILFK